MLTEYCISVVLPLLYPFGILFIFTHAPFAHFAPRLIIRDVVYYYFICFPVRIFVRLLLIRSFVILVFYPCVYSRVYIWPLYPRFSNVIRPPFYGQMAQLEFGHPYFPTPRERRRGMRIFCFFFAGRVEEGRASVCWLGYYFQPID